MIFVPHTNNYELAKELQINKMKIQDITRDRIKILKKSWPKVRKHPNKQRSMERGRFTCEKNMREKIIEQSEGDEEGIRN